MSNFQHQDFQKAYREVLALPAQERRALIAEKFAEHEEIHARLLELIGAHGEDLFLLPAEDQNLSLDESNISEGIQLGDFRLVRELGRGGMGVVYLAEQESLGRQVALKLFRPAIAGAKFAQKDFVEEARAIARLRHPGVVPVYTVGEAAGFPYFALEYVPGSNLAEALVQVTQGKPSILPSRDSVEYFSTVARILAEIAEALAHAHGQGLLHRDIKPSNILLDEDGVARLTDFGLAKSVLDAPETMSEEIKGTVYYMSPEQVRERRPQQDARSDVYSLGVVLYEALGLRKPFDGASFTQVLQQVQRREATPLRKGNARIPRDLALICETAMAKRPDDRYEAAALMATDLRRFLAHEAISVEPPSILRKSVRWMARHKLPLSIAAMAIVAGGIGMMSADELRDYQNFPQLSVVATDPQYRRIDNPGTVSVRRIDVPTGVPGPLEEIGPLPLSAQRMEPGYYRVVVTYPSGWFTEHIRYLAEGDKELVRSVFRDQTLGTLEAWVTVAGGDFWVPQDENSFWPFGEVSMPVAGFQIAKMEATNEQYREYLLATGIEAPAWWKEADWNPEWDQLPISQLTWLKLRDFAEWSGARCPTLLEWSRAAHGEKFRKYTWAEVPDFKWKGNTQGRFVGGLDFPANTEPGYLSAVMAELRPVHEPNEDVTLGSFGQAPGLFHMLGNVRECTETISFDKTPKGLIPKFNNRFTVAGSWETSLRPDSLLTLTEYNITERYLAADVGIRFCKSLTP